MCTTKQYFAEMNDIYWQLDNWTVHKYNMLKYETV